MRRMDTEMLVCLVFGFALWSVALSLLFLLPALVVALFARLRKQACGTRPRDHRRVVAIGREEAVGPALRGVADHVEQALGLIDAVDAPAGAEDLVAAVHGIGLREHHEFNVAGIVLVLV